MNIKYADIWIANLNTHKINTSVQQGIRPVVIISNDECNKYSPTITVVPITSKLGKNPLPTHVILGTECGLNKRSVVLAEQLITLDKYMLIKKVGKCTQEVIVRIETAIDIQVNKNKIKNNTLNLKKINDLIEKIKDTDRFISLCTKRGYSYDEELIQRSLLLAELIVFCNKHSIDYKQLLIKKGIINKNKENLLRKVL